MDARLRRVLVVAATAAAVTVLVAPAGRAAQGNATVQGGTLGFTGFDVGLPSRTLNAQNQTASATSSSDWIARDARGTGNGWAVTVAASGDLTSAPGSLETEPRSLAISSLSFDPGAVTARPGSDPTTNITPGAVTLSTAPATFLSCSSVCKGRYEFRPTLTLAIPANAFRSNYSGAVGGSSLNPYTVTLTFTIS